MQQRLIDIGRWLEVNGEAIYGSTSWRRDAPGRTNMPEDLFFTVKGDALYLISTRWPEGEIVIDGIAADDVTAVSMLGFTRAIDWSARADGIEIRLPVLTPAELPCEHAWVLKIEGVFRRNTP